MHSTYIDAEATGHAPTSRWVFPSLGDYADALTALGDKRARGAQESSIDSDPDKAEWYGNMDLPRALATARDGGYWQEATQFMRPLDLDQARLLNAHAMEVPTLQNDIAGFAPVVPHAIMGVPDQMLATPPVLQPNKTLRIGIGIIPTAHVSREATFNRGNAIVSIIDALETHCGFSCELVAIWAAKAGSTRTLQEITCKTADHHWDPASVAFALCHAAFGRRLGFRWAESQPETAKLTQSSYGYHYAIDQANASAPAAERFDLVFENLMCDYGFASRAEGVETLLKGTLDALATAGAPDHNPLVNVTG